MCDHRETKKKQEHTWGDQKETKENKEKPKTIYEVTIGKQRKTKQRNNKYEATIKKAKKKKEQPKKIDEVTIEKQRKQRKTKAHLWCDHKEANKHMNIQRKSQGNKQNKKS